MILSVGKFSVWQRIAHSAAEGTDDPDSNFE